MSFESQQAELKTRAKAAIKRLGGVDGAIGIRRKLASTTISPLALNGEDVSNSELKDHLISQMPDLLAVLTWAHYALQEQQP